MYRGDSSRCRRTIAWVSGVVRVRKHSSCSSASTPAVKCENGRGRSSPGCRSRRSSSRSRRRMRGGVPVFIRPTLSPSSRRLPVSAVAAASPRRPPASREAPTNIIPPRKVPVERTTVRVVIAPRPRSSSPTTRLAGVRTEPSVQAAPAPRSRSIGDLARPDGSVRTPTTSPSRTSRFSCSRTTRVMTRLYRSRSACARGPQTAGPLPVLSIRYCTPASSIARPICPPSASISRTRWPFARPPIAGLHDMRPTLSQSSVIIAVARPLRAAASAASIPACPAPTTTTSYRRLTTCLPTSRCRSERRSGSAPPRRPCAR